MFIGKAVTRREDGRFLTGRGTYVDDVSLADTCHAAFVRSPHAHARILNIDTGRAAAMPGVLAVLTAKDWSAAGLGILPCIVRIASSDGRPMNEATRPALAGDKARHVGDTLAAVIAETRWQAHDAAEAVEVDYEPLPALTDVARALDEGAPIVHEAFATNLAFELDIGDAAATAAGFAAASHVATLELINNRLTANSIEPRAYLGHYDGATEHYTFWSTSQTPHMLRRWIAEHSLKIPEHKLRVIAPDVGGGFGMKVYHYPEEPVVLWASKLLGRPVRWTGTRSEALMTDTHGRDHSTRARMAFAEDGRILALEVDTMGTLGAYATAFGALIVGAAYPRVLPGQYKIPALHCRIHGVYTNTTPMGAYRGAGRPEAIYVTERLIENGARAMGIDVCEMRARNLIQAHEFPHTTAVNITYDCGDYPAMLEKVKARAGYEDLRAEQRQERADGALMGIGLAAFVDRTGAGPTRTGIKKIGEFGTWESAHIRVHPSGKVSVFSGNHSHGQGHETVFAQLAADALGLDMDDIEIIEGDTDRVPFGQGSWGSRSIATGGMAILGAAERIIRKGQKLAAHILECAEEDVTYQDGAFAVAGTDRRIAFTEIAKAAYHGGNYPDGFELGLDETVFHDPSDFNYPAGTQLCVVLVDPETGRVQLRDFTSIDDAGRLVNPTIVAGQVHGGLAQGIGQALMEHIIYDAESGQLLTGTFMDYGMPRAADLPTFQLGVHETLSPSNALGVKGIGESGSIGAPAAVANAVVDALWHLGVRHVDMPLTAERVWRAVQSAAV